MHTFTTILTSSLLSCAVLNAYAYPGIVMLSVLYVQMRTYAKKIN